MLKKLTFFLTFFFLFCLAFGAQKKKTSVIPSELTLNYSKPIKKNIGVKKTYGYVCSYIEDDLDESKKLCDFFQGKSFLGNKNAEIALDKILSSIGASKTFILQECSGVNNASATSYKGIRYIFYNDSFMNKIVNRTNSWSNLSILAHEVGHHINGHTMDMVLYANDVVTAVSKEKGREQELEADYFSGFVMAKLGATSSEATQVMAMISSDADDTNSSHPAKSKRLEAITKGFKAGYVKPSVVVNSPVDKQETSSQPLPKTKVPSYEDYFYSAVDKHQSNDKKGAVDDYNQSIKLNSKFAPAYHNRGIIKDDLKNYQDAIMDFDMAISLLPDYPLYYYNRAVSKNNIEDYLGVISDLDQVIKNDSTNLIAYKFRGQSKYNLEMFKEAIIDFDSAISLDGSYSELYYLRGTSKGFFEDHREAIKDFDEAISIDSSISIYYSNRAVSKIKIKDLKGAIEDYTKLIEFDVNDPEYYLNRAGVKYDMNDNDGACEDWTKANELGSEEAVLKLKKFCRIYKMKQELKNGVKF